MTKAEIDDVFGEFEIDEDYMLKSKDVIGLFVAVKRSPRLRRPLWLRRPPLRRMRTPMPRRRRRRRRRSKCHHTPGRPVTMLTTFQSWIAQDYSLSLLLCTTCWWRGLHCTVQYRTLHCTVQYSAVHWYCTPWPPFCIIEKQ